MFKFKFKFNLQDKLASLKILEQPSEYYTKFDCSSFLSTNNYYDWYIESVSFPEIDVSIDTLYLRGTDESKDNRTTEAPLSIKRAFDLYRALKQLEKEVQEI